MKKLLTSIINNRVEKLRKHAGLSQANLAKKAGVSRLLILRTEKKYHCPDLDNAIKIAKALDESPDYVFYSDFKGMLQNTLDNSSQA